MRTTPPLRHSLIINDQIRFRKKRNKTIVKSNLSRHFTSIFRTPSAPAVKLRPFSMQPPDILNLRGNRNPLFAN